MLSGHSKRGCVIKSSGLSTNAIITRRHTLMHCTYILYTVMAGVFSDARERAASRGVMRLHIRHGGGRGEAGGVPCGSAAARQDEVAIR